MLTHVKMFVNITPKFFALTDGSISIPLILIGRNVVFGKTFVNATIRYSVLSAFSLSVLFFIHVCILLIQASTRHSAAIASVYLENQYDTYN